MNTGEVIALIKAFGGGGGGSSGGGVLYLTADATTHALSKNIQEIKTALDNGQAVVFKDYFEDADCYSPISRVFYLPEEPYFGVAFFVPRLKTESYFSNTTGPTDPLVVEE